MQKLSSKMLHGFALPPITVNFNSVQTYRVHEEYLHYKACEIQLGRP